MDAIGPESRIADILATRAGADRVLFEEFGLPCFECAARHVETLADGVSYTGLDPAVVLARLAQLPVRPDPEA